MRVLRLARMLLVLRIFKFAAPLRRRLQSVLSSLLELRHIVFRVLFVRRCSNSGDDGVLGLTWATCRGPRHQRRHRQVHRQHLADDADLLHDHLWRQGLTRVLLHVLGGGCSDRGIMWNIS